MNVCFETFGCRLSRAEALDQESEFLVRGWQRTESHADADLIVVRGCSVTQRAQRDCERLIAHIKAKYPHKKLVITGCLPQTSRPFILKPRPADNPAPVPSRTSRAYLKVQDGCSGRCSFCIVPRFRGKSVSVDFDEVLAKARRFFDAGYREIVVTGCNLSLYTSKGKRLDTLLASLAEIASPSTDAPFCRIRLGSLEPSPVAEDVLTVMSDHDNICRYLHVPIQSGSTPILVAMRRPYSARDIDELIHKAKSCVPGVEIGCDIITGFPGESDLDFLATKSLLTRVRPSRVHVFPFSERPGTLAASMFGKIPRGIAKARAQELSSLADRLRGERSRTLIGKSVEFVVEDEKSCSGWTSEYFWCKCPRGHAKRKSIVKATVRGTEGHILIGDCR